MQALRSLFKLLLSCILIAVISACTTYNVPPDNLSKNSPARSPYNPASYTSRLPSHLNVGEKTILVDPNVHAWGAYDASGNLIRAGLATAGSNWCADLGRPCHTKPGSYRINSLGGPGCVSSIFPLPRGGAPMPYCMFFHGGQALHGSASNHVVEGNISHGCVRLHVSDALWLRYNFANIGTKVVVKRYF